MLSVCAREVRRERESPDDSRMSILGRSGLTVLWLGIDEEVSFVDE